MITRNPWIPAGGHVRPGQHLSGRGVWDKGLSILRLQRLIVDHSDGVARRLDDLTHSPDPSQAPASASKAVGEKALNRGDGRHGTFVQSPRTGPEGWGCEQRSRCVYFSAEDGGKKYTTEHRAGLTWACPPIA